MTNLDTQTLISDDYTSYMVIADAMDLLGVEGVYIVYTQGNTKKLYRLYKHYNSLFEGKDIYFIFTNINYLQNNSEPTEWARVLKYKGE